MSQADILLEHLTVTAHEHNVIDDDQAFIVDPVTRKITTSNPDRFVLVQSDHNSKVFTFKIPRFIEGHDMALCDKVKVLYNNVEANSKKDKPTADGVYETSDLHIVDKNTVACSWEISDNATQYEGTLHFALIFLCMDGPVVTYRWGTDFYDDVVVLKKIGSELSFQTMHIDVIEQWKAAVKREFSVYITQTVAGDVAVAKSELDAQLHNDMDNRYAEMSKVVNDKHAEIDEQIEAIDTFVHQETSDTNNEIEVLKARMDTFTSLPDDSGASDAELTDVRVGTDGKLYGSAGTAVREQINDVATTLKNTELVNRIRDFVKRNNLAKVIDVSRTNSDGTSRTITHNTIDRAHGIINGPFYSASSYMPMTDYFTLEAGKVYTVYVIDEDPVIDYSMFLYTKNGSTYQENGKNVGVAGAITKPYGILHPETTGDYCLGLYMNFTATMHNANYHVYIIEGEYTVDELLYLNTKEEIDDVVSNIQKLSEVPTQILDNSLITMQNTYIQVNRQLSRSAEKRSKSMTVLNGNFAGETLTRLTENFVMEAGKTYTVYAVGNLSKYCTLLFVNSDTGAVLKQYNKNVSVPSTGLSYISPNYSGNANVTLYSQVQQTLDNEKLDVYVVEGKLTMDEVCSYVSNVELKMLMENRDDLDIYRKEILDANLVSMVFYHNASRNNAYATPSIYDRSITRLNGDVHSMRFSGTFDIEAGKKYTVCAVDTRKDVKYTVFLGDITDGLPVQMNGVNKGFGVFNSTFCGTYIPDKSATVYAYLYNDSGAILEDRYLRLIVLEGEYKYEDLIKPVVAEKENVGFDYTAYKLPILRLTGSTSGISKDDKVTLNYAYEELSGTCTLKWQGSSSIAYPKKNYTITFDNTFEAAVGWGEQKKYCLKANWIDFSHARNVISAKLWGQIVKSRAVKNDKLYDLPNGGAIDGFPVMVVINDVYQGLYTFNIPKDAWMFNMGDDINEFIVVADDHTEATRFKKETTVEEVENETTFAIEYIPDGVETQTVVASLNTLIDRCMNSTGTKYRETVAPYIDMDSAIDYYIFACLLTAADGTDKNYILGSYDGVKWFFSAYDLDTTFGNCWDGKSYYDVAAGPTFRSYKSSHRLMHLIYTYDKAALKARYTELRATVLSEANIMNTFYNYLVDIPKALFDEEVKIWPTIPGTHTNNLTQIINYYMMRCKVMDAEIEAL